MHDREQKAQSVSTPAADTDWICGPACIGEMVSSASHIRVDNATGTKPLMYAVASELCTMAQLPFLRSLVEYMLNLNHFDSPSSISNLLNH